MNSVHRQCSDSQFPNAFSCFQLVKLLDTQSISTMPCCESVSSNLAEPHSVAVSFESESGSELLVIGRNDSALCPKDYLSFNAPLVKCPTLPLSVNIAGARTLKRTAIATSALMKCLAKEEYIMIISFIKNFAIKLETLQWRGKRKKLTEKDPGNPF